MKKILILFTAIGHGHKVIAENIGAALKTRGQQVDLLNIIELEKGNLSESSTSLYLWVVNHAPWIWNFLYTNKVFLKLSLPFRTLVAGFKSKKLLEVLNKTHYDVVISVHTNGSAIMSYLKSRGLYKGKFVIGFSDYHLHPYWLYKNADLFLVNIEEQRQEMIQMGYDSQKIVLCGITMPEKQEYNVSELRTKHGLGPNEKMILVMGGSSGFGITPELVASVSGLGAKVYIVCGTNEELKKDLERFYKNNSNVVVLGYVNYIQELYAIASIAVTKPGGLTIAGCLLWNLPVVVSGFLPGMEELNIKYLAANNLIIPEFVNIRGAVKHELETGLFAKSLKENPTVKTLVQHGEAAAKAIAEL